MMMIFVMIMVTAWDNRDDDDDDGHCGSDDGEDYDNDKHDNGTAQP